MKKMTDEDIQAKVHEHLRTSLPAAMQMDRLVERIKPILGEVDPTVQGMVLADLLALWLAGHPAFIRDELIAAHVDTVRELTPVIEMIMFGPAGHPQKRPGAMSEIDAIPAELPVIGLRCWVEALADGTPDAGKIIARALLAERLAQRERDAEILAAIDPLAHPTTIGLWKAMIYAISGIDKPAIRNPKEQEPAP